MTCDFAICSSGCCLGCSWPNVEVAVSVVVVSGQTKVVVVVGIGSACDSGLGLS